MSKQGSKGPVDAIVGVLGRALEDLAPKVPPAGAAVAVVLIAGLLVELGLVVLGADTASVAVIAVVVVVAMGVVAYLLRDYSRPGAENAADTTALRLNQGQKDAVCDVVCGAVDDAAAVLGAEPGSLRGNVWGCDGAGTLHILPAFGCNMATVQERALDWPVGQGNVGRAWSTGRPSTLADPDDPTLAKDQKDRVNPALAWVVSVPVFPATRPGPEPTWILSVDGLHVRRSKNDLRKVERAMGRHAAALARILEGVAK